MNRDYYNNLSEAYLQVEQSQTQQNAKDNTDRTIDAVGGAINAVGGAAKNAYNAASKNVRTRFRGLSRGLDGKKVNRDAPIEVKTFNAAGRGLKNIPGNPARWVRDNIVGSGQSIEGKARNALNKEEIEALLNSPNLTEEEREAFIAMIDEERKDEAGMSPDEKSIGRSIKAGMNPATDHMAAATRQRLHLSQRGKKKPIAHSKETRLPAQQLRSRKANDGVKEFGEELLQDLAAELMEGGFAGISDEALEKAAAATLKRHKEQGYKVPGTDAMHDVIKRIEARKKGQV